jgi:CRISPR/Cas system CMR subunit Cmr4 (Cas7 group RAMP superfamily)
VVGRGDCRHKGTSDPSRVELLDARLMTLPTKVIDGVLHYVYGRD